VAEQEFFRSSRGLTRRRRGGTIGRTLPLVLVVAGALFAALRIATGSLLEVKRVAVFGQERARTEEVLRRIEGWRGANLLTLDLESLAARILEHPWIERVSLSKRFPDALEVRIREREPIAVLRRGSQLFWLGRDGRAIAPYDPRSDRREYVLVGGEERAVAESIALLEELRRSVPEYFSALSEIDALPDAGFGMMDSIFRKPVRVLRRDAPEKIRALLGARGLIESRGWEARVIDLRFADQIVLVGAYGAGNSL
jgi:cell division protein FtsQ